MTGRRVQTIQQAVELLQTRANAAQHHDATVAGKGRWIAEHHNSQYHTESHRAHIAEDRAGHYWSVAHQVYIPVADYMALMDPRTGLAIAAWLQAETSPIRRLLLRRRRHAMRVADELLRIGNGAP